MQELQDLDEILKRNELMLQGTRGGGYAGEAHEGIQGWFREG